jgi:hypothetical protein
VDLHEENPMAKGYFVVRAKVPDEADRAKFNDWYATDHLPWAIKIFGAQRGWPCWSGTDPAVHYAFYEFADVGKAQALIGSEKIKPLVADFDRVWGNRRRCSRDTATLGLGAFRRAYPEILRGKGPMVRRLSAGGSRIRTLGPA